MAPKPSPPFLTVDVDESSGAERPRSMLWEPVEFWQRARNFTFSLVEPVENLEAKPGSPTTFPTSTGSDTLRLSWSRR